MTPELNLKPDIQPPKSKLPTDPVGNGKDSALYPIPSHGPLVDFDSSPPPRKKKHFENWRSIVSTGLLFLLAPLIAIFIAAFIVQSYQVDGQSMETTLQNDDRLIVEKWPRTWARITGHAYVPGRGDIIIFNQSGLDPSGANKQLIKRVIGLPGERVVVKDNAITIYNQEHPGGFNPDKAGAYTIAAPLTPGDVDLTLKSGEIFVSGDNRTNSEDSRYFGPVNTNQIVGKLAFRIVPLNKAQRF